MKLRVRIHTLIAISLGVYLGLYITQCDRDNRPETDYAQGIRP